MIGAVRGMNDEQGNRSTRMKPVSVLHCAPQVPPVPVLHCAPQTPQVPVLHCAPQTPNE
jgi:hypothetical protein